jgi:hypothetical protein
MKKIFIIAGSVVLLCILGFGAWFFFGHTNSAAVSSGNAPQQNGNPQEFTPIYSAPTSTTIVLGTSNGLVTINNFYLTALGAQDEFIVLAKNDNYEITYDTTTNSFYIYIRQAPFVSNRTQAEQNLLKILNINPSDACKLGLKEGFAQGSSMTNSGVGLSFCASGYSN